MLGDKLNKKLGQVSLPSQSQGGPPNAPQFSVVNEPWFHIYAYCLNGQNPTVGVSPTMGRFTIGNEFVSPPGPAWVYGATGMGTTKWEIANMGNYTFNEWLPGTPLTLEFFRVETLTDNQVPWLGGFGGVTTWKQTWYGIPNYPGCDSPFYEQYSPPPFDIPGPVCYDQCFQYLGKWQCGDLMSNGEYLDCSDSAGNDYPEILLIENPILFISHYFDPLPHSTFWTGYQYVNQHISSCSLCDGNIPDPLYECAPVPGGNPGDCECVESPTGIYTYPQCTIALLNNEPDCCPQPPDTYVCDNCNCTWSATGTLTFADCQYQVTNDLAPCCPPAPDMYICNNCVCTLSAIGTLSLAQCQNLVATQTAPCCPPSNDLYTCTNCQCNLDPVNGTLTLGQCQTLVANQTAPCCSPPPNTMYICDNCTCMPDNVNGTLTLAQCQTLVANQTAPCCAPAPDMYVCDNCTCTISATGTLSLAECQYLVTNYIIPCCSPPPNQDEKQCLPALTKEEFLMNVCQEPETRGDVFIERGKVAVFDTCQRLAVNPTIGELELHGYGYYNFVNQS